MSGRIAGYRPQRETVTVDYADVLKQAVENERWRVLREVRAAVEAVQSQVSARTYGMEDRSGPTVKREILAAIDGIGS